MQQATARAHPNIAFIKYWGNRDAQLRLPANSSLSMNLDGLHAETTVTWSNRQPADTFVLNGSEQSGLPLARVSAHLDHLRRRLNIQAQAHVESANNFPTGAGVASSAAAFAALTVAAVAAAWLFDAIPLLPVLAVAAIAVFNVAAVRGPVRRAVVIGLQQMTFGIAVVAVTAIAVLT